MSILQKRKKQRSFGRNHSCISREEKRGKGRGHCEVLGYFNASTGKESWLQPEAAQLYYYVLIHCSLFFGIDLSDDERFSNFQWGGVAFFGDNACSPVNLVLCLLYIVCNG